MCKTARSPVFIDWFSHSIGLKMLMLLAYFFLIWPTCSEGVISSPYLGLCMSPAVKMRLREAAYSLERRSCVNQVRPVAEGRSCAI